MTTKEQRDEFEKAVYDWKSHDEWQFADTEACWKFMFNAGRASVIDSQQPASVDASAAVDKAWARFQAVVTDGKSASELQMDLSKEERSHSVTIDQRDRAEDFADKLADEVERISGQEVGEHSNLNCPWENALEILQAMKPADEQPSPSGVMEADTITLKKCDYDELMKQHFSAVDTFAALRKVTSLLLQASNLLGLEDHELKDTIRSLLTARSAARN